MGAWPRGGVASGLSAAGAGTGGLGAWGAASCGCLCLWVSVCLWVCCGRSPGLRPLAAGGGRVPWARPDPCPPPLPPRRRWASSTSSRPSSCGWGRRRPSTCSAASTCPTRRRASAWGASGWRATRTRCPSASSPVRGGHGGRHPAGGHGDRGDSPCAAHRQALRCRGVIEGTWWGDTGATEETWGGGGGHGGDRGYMGDTGGQKGHGGDGGHGPRAAHQQNCGSFSVWVGLEGSRGTWEGAWPRGGVVPHTGGGALKMSLVGCGWERGRGLTTWAGLRGRPLWRGRGGGLGGVVLAELGTNRGGGGVAPG